MENQETHLPELMDHASVHARAQRLKTLRQAIRLSRRKMGEKYQIPPGTLQNWEDGRYGGLSEKGARKMVEAFQAEGLICRIEWLLYGIGQDPVASTTQLSGKSFAPHVLNYQDEQSNIRKELQLFHQLNPNSIDCIITDATMMPFYQLGDLVAGCRRFGDDFLQFIGQPCIIQTATGQTLVRILESVNNPQGCYQLRATGPEASLASAAPFERSQLLSIAPITWWRRPGAPTRLN